MSHWWSPEKKLNTNGMFEHTDSGTIIIEKSDPWKQQRDLDGTPHTRPGATALRPPVAGPHLYVADMEKACSGDSGPSDDDMEKKERPDNVVKAYFTLTQDLISKGHGDIIKAAEEKSLSDDEDQPEDIEKS